MGYDGTFTVDIVLDEGETARDRLHRTSATHGLPYEPSDIDDGYTIEFWPSHAGRISVGSRWRYATPELVEIDPDVWPRVRAEAVALKTALAPCRVFYEQHRVTPAWLAARDAHHAAVRTGAGRDIDRGSS
jgi:hypothetical protein